MALQVFNSSSYSSPYKISNYLLRMFKMCAFMSIKDALSLKSLQKWVIMGRFETFIHKLFLDSLLKFVDLKNFTAQFYYLNWENRIDASFSCFLPFKKKMGKSFPIAVYWSNFERVTHKSINIAKKRDFRWRVTLAMT